jgi:carbamoyl-phosphate synthase large subunit
VSTDYDTSDRLYFEPVTLEDVLAICDVEQPWGVIVQFGGQTPLKLARALTTAGVPILGTPADAIDRAEDRERFGELIAALGLRAPKWGIARTVPAARRIAGEIGFPVMIRPSYVLGGRAMQRVDDAAGLEKYFAVLGATGAGSDESAAVGFPLLVDEFLVDAVEVDVDVVADATGAVVIGGVMEHVEPAGVHSGDSACALPPYSLAADVVEECKRIARVIAVELGVVGLMNVQLAVASGGDVYVLEVNPRASRTIPFVSKAIGVPLAKVAARVMAGKTLAELGVKEVVPRHVSVKEVVFPFVKFDGVDPLLGPEMRSTGEVMGIDEDFASAFGKAQLAAGGKLPAGGVVVVDDDEVGRSFAALGFEVVRRFQAGAELVIAVEDGSGELRRAAVMAGVPYVTTRRAVEATIAAIEAGESTVVRALQAL